MAHGFLSYQDNRGPSGIEKFLEKKFDEQTEKLGGLVKDRIRQGIINALFNLRTKSPRSPKPYSWAKEDSTPLGRMLSGSAFQKSLPGKSDAINPEHLGGELATFKKQNFVNFANALSPEPDASKAMINVTPEASSTDDMFAKSAVLANRGQNGETGEVVQAIDRLSVITMGVGAAIDAQTKNQSLIAQVQKQQSDKLARKALISSEASGFTSDDFSNNIAYEGLAGVGSKMLGGRGGGMGMGLGGGLLGGIGLKRSASLAGRQIMKKGAGRAGRRGLLKLGGRRLAKGAAKGVSKSLAKKIPLVGLGLGAIFAAQRAMSGDFVGAGLELASGAASTVPGVGTAASVGLDAALMAKDMTSMDTGGTIYPSKTNEMLNVGGRMFNFNEPGNEEVLRVEKDGPDSGLKIGEGILEAQRRRKGLFGKVQAEGLKEYYDKQGGWGRMGASFDSSLTFDTNIFDGFGETLKDILGSITLPMGYKPFNFNNKNGNSSDDSDSTQYGKKKDGFWSKRHSGEQMQVNADGVFASKVGGVVTKVGKHKDLGKYVDIVNEERGVTERIADISEVMPGIEVGASIGPGDPVAKGNDAGIVHYEIRNGGNENPEKYKAKFGHGGTKDPTEFLEGVGISNSTDINELSNVDNTSSTILNTLSEETSASGNGGTTIINNIVNNPPNTSSNQGDDVALAPRSEDHVSDLFRTLALRA